MVKIKNQKEGVSYGSIRYFSRRNNKKYLDTFESCIINISEGASDEKSMAVSWLNMFKEKSPRVKSKIVESK